MLWTLTAAGSLPPWRKATRGVDETLTILTYLALGFDRCGDDGVCDRRAPPRPRRGGGRVGAVLLAGGLSFAAIPFGYAVGGFLVQTRSPDPFANAVLPARPAGFPIGYSLILPVLALVFPHGQLPSRRWRWPAGLVTACLLASTGIRILAPGRDRGNASRNPFGSTRCRSAVAGLADPLAGLGILAVSVLGVAAVLVRYRRGSIVERQQLRWFVAAVMLAVIPIAIVTPAAESAARCGSLLASFGLLLVPVSVWIAITRYRLYELDRLISRTIGWAIVTGILVAVFALLVVALQAALAPVTDESTLAVAASTLVAFALFQPLRRRVQQAVDRRLDELVVTKHLSDRLLFVEWRESGVSQPLGTLREYCRRFGKEHLLQ